MKRRRPKSNPERDAWKQDHRECFVCCCWATDCHEIARGPHRAKALKEPAAWIAACTVCHHGPLDGMPIAKQLAYKAIHDLPNYDRVLVNRLRGRADNAVSEVEVLREVIWILRRDKR